MTKTQVEVITSVERRRRWSRAEKERIVAAALEWSGCIGGGARGRDPCEPTVSLAAGAVQWGTRHAGLCGGDDCTGAGRGGEPSER
jgi:transposase-like protein